MHIVQGLIIAAPWIGCILDGSKTCDRVQRECAARFPDTRNVKRLDFPARAHRAFLVLTLHASADNTSLTLSALGSS